MENEALLEVLEGIRAELQQLNKTIAAQGARPQQTERPERPAYDSRPSRPTGAKGRIMGGYKRPSSDDGEGTGYGAEMKKRFPPKKGTGARPKGKPGAKKTSGYPKKPR